MPTVEKVSGGRVYIRPLGRQFEIGDCEEVTDDQARYLCEERGDFERVDSDDDAPSDATERESEADDDGEDFSVNGWLENDYTDRADAVREGGLDDYLNEIEAAETSQTVLDAVEDRRAELEG